MALDRTIVLLLSITFTVVGMLVYWGSALISRTLKTAENTTAIETDCPSALFILYSGSYDESMKNLVLLLENKRSVELKIEAVYLFYPDMKTFQVNEILKGNQLKSIRITGVDDGFQTGRIKTNCPDVFVDFTYSQLT